MRINRTSSPFSFRRPERLNRVFNQHEDGTVEILLYDEIGFFGIDAETFVTELRDFTGRDVLVRINSPGGQVFQGMAIYSALRQHTGNVTTRIDGLAASIASVIALAGRTVEMANGAMLMIHEPFSIVIGDAEGLRKEADVLDKLAENLVGIYASRSELEPEDVRAKMRDETWFNAADAQASGLVDTVLDDAPARNHFDLSVFERVPDEAQALHGEPTTRDLERALRNAGLTQNAAKKLLSKGPGARDVQPAEDDTETVVALLEDARRAWRAHGT